jgi:beta-lactamase class A
MMRRPVLALLLTLLVPAAASAGDRALVLAVDRGVGSVASASRAAAGGAPSSVQVHYDRARDLQESVREAAPFSSSCRLLGGWAARYAAAEVASAEGFDRLDPARARRFRATAAVARTRLVSARTSCRPGPAATGAVIPALIEPRPWAASFGQIVARAPSGADAATLFANGASAGPLVIAGGVARARLTGRAGRYDLEVRFARAGVAVGRARSPGVWLLPDSASGSVRASDLDAGWQARVRDAVARFSGISAVWVHDLSSGRAASWNAGALFPAASTVKLGVLVEAARRMGPQPEESAVLHDARAIGAWSSNLAANRLLRRIGGSAGAQGALRRMGATSSTYTGPYIVATARPPVDALRQPPRVSGRVTSAVDLGTVMRVLHEAAIGNAGALAATRMTRTQARLVLGLLLSSEAAGDNLGLFRESLGAGVPAAQKHGWISSARHSAAVVYTARGPVVVVALTYQRPLARSAAARLGGELVTIATSAQ